MSDQLKITVLGCGGSGGVPYITGYWGECDPENQKNHRLRPSILLQKGETTIVIDTSADFRQQMLREPMICRYFLQVVRRLEAGVRPMLHLSAKDADPARVRKVRQSGSWGNIVRPHFQMREPIVDQKYILPDYATLNSLAGRQQFLERRFR